MWGVVGDIDYLGGVTCRNGYVWVEEDWAGKNYGIELSST